MRLSVLRESTANSIRPPLERNNPDHEPPERCYDTLIIANQLLDIRIRHDATREQDTFLRRAPQPAQTGGRQLKVIFIFSDSERPSWVRRSKRPKVAETVRFPRRPQPLRSGLVADVRRVTWAFSAFHLDQQPAPERSTSDSSFTPRPFTDSAVSAGTADRVE